MRIFLLLFLLIFTIGCATRNIKYNRIKILEKYSADYRVFVDNKKIDLETVFLDKDNIEKIRIDKRTKELKITQLKPSELFEMRDFKLDSLFPDKKIESKRKIGLIIIDGFLMTDSLKEKARIDLNSIKEISMIKEKTLNNITCCRKYDGDLLIITTK